MERSSIIGLTFLLSVSLSFCGVKREFQSEFPQEIKSVFYHKKLQGDSKDSIYLQIEFKKPLLQSIVLNTVYFRNQEATVKQVTPEHFTVAFVTQTSTEDFIMDQDPSKEYGNKAPDVSNAKFEIQSNEAVLNYTQNGKIYFFKMTNIIEKPLR
ncbi:hypothetical protein IWX83_003283 [Flavobacterium sp. CG_9.1]|uniref:Uncharacterized protein n=1 Tax=Flavobacterium xanthum TaxID=69322 RepID=A0A1M7IMK9_9FLAO|nr:MULTISPECIES: hypothetical protein [Flavobacterium]MBG6063473.1 hypothetical protein [Flavobacterium sp. CG_9.1]SHM41941.1 hypothetical protein SAMN05443669_103534 [Flavobacterium xanthum]